jgi:Tol biopolymer transport system component
MSGRFDVDRQLTAWLADERPSSVPDGLLESVIREVAVTPRRHGWRIADRWTWRHGAQVRLAARLIVLAVIAGAIIALGVWLLVVGSRHPAPPFGLTRAGLIAFDAAEGIVVSTADGTGRRVLIPPSGQSISPTWSLDGLLLAYWHRPDPSSAWSLTVVGADGRDASVLATDVRLRDREESLNQPSAIAWSPDSRQIAFAADTDGGQSIFLATIGREGATRITDPALQAVDPAWRPDGRAIAFQSVATETVHIVAPDGSAEHELNPLPYTFLWLDWAPDGSAVATAAFVPEANDPESGQNEVFTISADGGTVVNVSRDPSDDFSATWSPDGKRLAWGRVPFDQSARANIVVARLEAQTVLEIRVDADLAPPVWSPDGTRLFSYVQGADGGFHELIVIDPDGVAPIVHLPATGNVGNSNWQRLP